MTTTASINGAFAVATQPNIVRETSSASETVHGNYVSSTVWPISINTETMTVKPIAQHHEQIIFHFGWIDYSLFVALLGISTLIGIFYGFFSKHKQNNISEYIFGGRTLKVLPVATSMIASWVKSMEIRNYFSSKKMAFCFLFSRVVFAHSHISGQTFVGIPTEVYTHGTQYVVFVIAAILVRFIFRE